MALAGDNKAWTGVPAALALAGAWLLFLPFRLHFVALFGSLAPVHDSTDLLQFLSHFGALLAVAGIGLTTLLIPWQSPLSAGTLEQRRMGLFGAGALAGLMVETALITPITLGFIAFHLHRGTGPQMSGSIQLLVALSGIVTATPLLFFAAAARRLKLSTLGFLQYLSPTIQFLLAVLFLNEGFTRDRQITFACIWAAVILFIIDQVRAMRRAQPVVEAVEIDL